MVGARTLDFGACDGGDGAKSRRTSTPPTLWDIDSQLEQAADCPVRSPVTPDVTSSPAGGRAARRTWASCCRRLTVSERSEPASTVLDAESCAAGFEHLAAHPGAVVAVTHDRHLWTMGRVDS